MSSACWETFKPSGTSPLPRCHHSTIAVGTKILVYGGVVDGKVSSDLHVLNLEGLGGWNAPQATGVIPRARCAHTAVLSGKLMIVFGGLEGTNPTTPDGTLLNDINCLTVDKFVWSRPRTQGEPPQPVAGHSCVMIGLEAAVFGGRTEHGPTNSLHLFNTGSRVWTEIPQQQPCPSPRFGHAACLAGKTMYVYGGTNGAGTFYNDMWAFDTATKTWKELTPKTGSPPPVAFATMCTLDSFKIALTGGRDSTGVVECNLVFDAMQCSWSLIEGTKLRWYSLDPKDTVSRDLSIPLVPRRQPPPPPPRQVSLTSNSTRTLPPRLISKPNFIPSPSPSSPPSQQQRQQTNTTITISQPKINSRSQSSGNLFNSTSSSRIKIGVPNLRMKFESPPQQQPQTFSFSPFENQTPRYGHTLCETGHKLYLIGGFGPAPITLPSVAIISKINLKPFSGGAPSKIAISQPPPPSTTPTTSTNPPPSTSPHLHSPPPTQTQSKPIQPQVHTNTNTSPSPPPSSTNLKASPRIDEQKQQPTPPTTPKQSTSQVQSPVTTQTSQSQQQQQSRGPTMTTPAVEHVKQELVSEKLRTATEMVAKLNAEITRLSKELEESKARGLLLAKTKDEEIKRLQAVVGGSNNSVADNNVRQLEQLKKDMIAAKQASDSEIKRLRDDMQKHQEEARQIESRLKAELTSSQNEVLEEKKKREIAEQHEANAQAVLKAQDSEKSQITQRGASIEQELRNANAKLQASMDSLMQENSKLKADIAVNKAETESIASRLKDEVNKTKLAHDSESTISEKLSRAESEVEKLRASIASLSKPDPEIEKLRSQIKSLESLHATSTQQQSELEHRLNTAESHATELQSKLDAKIREVATLEQSVKESEQRATSLSQGKAETQKLLADLEKLRTSLADAERRASEAEAKVAGAHSEVAALNSQLQERSKAVEKAKEESSHAISTAENRVSDLTKQLSDSNGKVEELNRRVVELQKKLDSANEQMKVETLAKTTAESKLVEAMAETGRVKAQQESLNASTTSKSEQMISELKSQIQKEIQAKEQAQTRANNAELQIKELEAKMDAISKKTAGADGIAADLQKKLQEEIKLKEAAELKVRTAETKVDELQSKNVKLEEDLRERDMNLDNTRVELSQWETKFAEGAIVDRAEIDALKQQIQELQHQSSSSTAASPTAAAATSGTENELRGKIEELQNSLQTMEEDRNQWRDLSEQIEKLGTQSLSEHEQKLAEAQETINQLSARKDQLERDLQISDQKLGQLDSILQRLTKKR